MIFTCTHGWAQVGIAGNSDYTITKRLISVEDGLASHEVFCGVQDKEGFLWFGTRNGLNRYDGKNCLLFTRQRQNLQDNKVVQLAKDDGNNLFIEYGSIGFKLTTNGKVDVMNASTMEVKTLTKAFPNMPFKEQDVYWISNDGTADINILTAYPFRLWKYSSKKGFTLRYQIDDWDKQPVADFVDYRSTGPVCMFAKGTALLKLTNLVKQYLINEDTVITFRQADVLRSLPIGFTRQNDLLITYNTNANSNAFTVGMVTAKGQFDSTVNLNEYSLNEVAGKYWYQVVNSSNGAYSIFYISTDAIYLWSENVFLRVMLKSEMKGFENLFLYQLFPDNLGNFWLCTSNGVLQLTIEKNRFTQYFTINQQNVETNNQARGIYADERKVVANIWSHIFLQKGDSIQNTVNEEIKYAVIKHNSKIYCGGYNLFFYDESKNKISVYPGGQGSEIWSMFSINDSLLLLGRSNGIFVFNSNTGKFDSIITANKNIARPKFVYRFFTGNNKTLWAVAENGLFSISGIHGQWSIYNYESAFLHSLSLLDAYQDKTGVFWLATSGEGLYRWDPATGTSRQFNITSGFPSDVVYRIEPDHYNNLWISSDYGLVRFNLATFSVNTYTTVNGISHNEFNRTSSFDAQDGRLFFGGLDGINAFYPRDFVADTNKLNVPVRITSFNQFVNSKNGLVNKTNELLNTSEIILAPNDKFFTLEFQMLDFAKDEVHRYAYKIEGVDKEWNYISENSIRISGLPYGKFHLHIKAQNREGEWSRSELNIPVLVQKPFYFQWWFILLLAALLLIIVYLVIHFRIKQLAGDKRKLEQTVNERTQQLKQSIAAQSALLLEKDVLMKEIHHRVKNNLQVISGLLELQSKRLTDKASKDALREGRNRVRSIALIHQNLYQSDSISTIEVKRFINDLCRQVQNVFQREQAVAINIVTGDLHLDIDSAVPLGLIMNELLSNSFKYAFDDVTAGEINLEIRVLAEGKFQLVYADNGPGMPAEFNVAKASTLGIQLINDLSRQIGGNVRFENKKGTLCTINFTNREMRKKED